MTSDLSVEQHLDFVRRYIDQRNTGIFKIWQISGGVLLICVIALFYLIGRASFTRIVFLMLGILLSLISLLIITMFIYHGYVINLSNIEMILKHNIIEEMDWKISDSIIIMRNYSNPPRSKFSRHFTMYGISIVTVVITLLITIAGSLLIARSNFSSWSILLVVLIDVIFLLLTGIVEGINNKTRQKRFSELLKGIANAKGK